ncbi:hypothetical protein [Aliiruegeria sabulilitoris]|uniref:hypothetical protein n=1 Tax=Aliiruegeria sabulilitoris TaxID=1510458 RepID=UPI0012E33A26|nr:hypothetical protein [Aliiruegeria sabulilitoris]NDR55392.1 hypothetical protein [Pseudoruegeria sp. M32A2M]
MAESTGGNAPISVPTIAAVVPDFRLAGFHDVRRRDCRQRSEQSCGKNAMKGSKTSKAHGGFPFGGSWIHAAKASFHNNPSRGTLSGKRLG